MYLQMCCSPMVKTVPAMVLRTYMSQLPMFPFLERMYLERTS